MLWPAGISKNFKEFPVSRYEWLIVSADVFLARYISVVDCAIILVNEVFECGLMFEACTIQNLKRRPVPVLTHLGEMIGDQGLLRKERNSRFHHGLNAVLVRTTRCSRHVRTSVQRDGRPERPAASH
jgi:hypothetical protein